MPILNLTDREFCTVLAALRHWQESGHGTQSVYRSTDIEYIAAEAGPPLSDEEIETLCERINERCVCEMPGHFASGIPGILAHVSDGRIRSKVERCDACNRFPTDAAAEAFLVGTLTR